MARKRKFTFEERTERERFRKLFHHRSIRRKCSELALYGDIVWRNAFDKIKNHPQLNTSMKELLSSMIDRPQCTPEAKLNNGKYNSREKIFEACILLLDYYTNLIEEQPSERLKSNDLAIQQLLLLSGSSKCSYFNEIPETLITPKSSDPFSINISSASNSLTIPNNITTPYLSPSVNLLSMPSPCNFIQNSYLSPLPFYQNSVVQSPYFSKFDLTIDQVSEFKQSCEKMNLNRENVVKGQIRILAEKFQIDQSIVKKYLAAYFEFQKRN